VEEEEGKKGDEEPSPAAAVAATDCRPVRRGREERGEGLGDD